MGVCNRQPLAEDKGVHCKEESEGSRKQNSALRNTNHIRHNHWDEATIQVEVQKLHRQRDVNMASNGPGVHIAGFYTPTLGIGGGQGLTAGVSMSFYPTASIENLGGFGAAAGYFLTDNPVGLGPVFAGELNSTDPVQANVNFGGTIGINPLSIGAGGGIYGELTYTFLSDVVKIADLADNALVQQLSETFGVSKDVIIKGINSLSGELGNLTESYRSQMLNTGEFDLSKGYIAPSDNTRVAIPQRIIIDEEIKQ